MDSGQDKTPEQQADICCSRCGKFLESGEGYSRDGRYLCVDCAMELGMSPARKTHWQYLGAIKTD